MAGKVVVVLLLALCVAVAVGEYTESEYQSSFTQWMSQRGKAYSSSEFASRFSAFKNNMDFCKSFNERNESFTVGLNDFADMTVSEFRALLLNPIARETRSVGEEEFTGEGSKVARTNPSLDWRTKGAVVPIKNQGQCGSCWTFATAAAIESVNQIAGNTLTSLSEQNLLDCVSGSSGCGGGSFTSAMQYVITNNGIDTESSYPYTGTQATCAYNAANAGATISSWMRVTANDENALLTAVTNQPVAVAIRGDLQSFQNYRSGTYNDASCTNSTLNHAVVVIGYGTDTSNANYWLIRNSWGTSWGIQGYAQLARGVNMCGLASQPAFPSKASTAGWIWQDNLYTGWNLAYSGTVTNIVTNAAGVTGYAVSASIASGSRLLFSHGSTGYSTSGFKTFSFAIKCSTPESVSYNIGSTSLTVSCTTSYQTITAQLSSLGSLASVTAVSFFNKGTSTATFYFDNVRFQ